MGADVFGDAPTVPTKIPKPATLKGLRPPALVIVAGSTRVHHPGPGRPQGRQRLANARVETVRRRDPLRAADDARRPGRRADAGAAGDVATA